MSHRQFTDSSGAVWDVWDVHPISAVQLLSFRGSAADDATRSHCGVAPGLANGWLCFEQGNDRRRLAPVPPGWDALDDAGLERLCHGALRVVRDTARGRSSGTPEISDRA